MARIIHTSLYGAYAKEVIEAVAGHLSDGRWENTRGYDKYWTNFRVETLDDGEIVFNVRTEYYNTWCGKYLDNPFVKMNDDQFKQWYASKLKAIICDEGRHEKWKRGWWNHNNVENNTVYLNYDLEVKVAHVYAVYEVLLGRDVNDTKYYNKIITDVFGEKKSEEATAKTTAYRKAKSEIQSKYLAMIKDAETEKRKLIDRMTKEINDKYYAKCKELREQESEELSKLEAV